MDGEETDSYTPSTPQRPLSSSTLHLDNGDGDRPDRNGGLHQSIGDEVTVETTGTWRVTEGTKSFFNSVAPVDISQAVKSTEDRTHYPSALVPLQLRDFLGGPDPLSHTPNAYLDSIPQPADVSGLLPVRR